MKDELSNSGGIDHGLEEEMGDHPQYEHHLKVLAIFWAPLCSKWVCSQVSAVYSARGTFSASQHP